MKKNYIQPATTVVAVAYALLLGASNPNVTVNTSGSVNAAEVDTKESGNWSNIWE